MPRDDHDRHGAKARVGAQAPAYLVSRRAGHVDVEQHDRDVVASAPRRARRRRRRTTGTRARLRPRTPPSSTRPRSSSSAMIAMRFLCACVGSCARPQAWLCNASSSGTCAALQLFAHAARRRPLAGERESLELLDSLRVCERADIGRGRRELVAHRRGGRQVVGSECRVAARRAPASSSSRTARRASNRGRLACRRASCAQRRNGVRIDAGQRLLRDGSRRVGAAERRGGRGSSSRARASAAADADSPRACTACSGCRPCRPRGTSRDNARRRAPSARRSECERGPVDAVRAALLTPNQRRRAKPSMSGMLRSMRIRSKRSAAAQATASAPFFTQVEVQPSACEIAFGDRGVHGLVLDEQHVGLRWVRWPSPTRRVREPPAACMPSAEASASCSAMRWTGFRTICFSGSSTRRSRDSTSADGGDHDERGLRRASADASSEPSVVGRVPASTTTMSPSTAPCRPAAPRDRARPHGAQWIPRATAAA